MCNTMSPCTYTTPKVCFTYIPAMGKVLRFVTPELFLRLLISLACTWLQLNHADVMALVHILVHVLDGFDGGDNLHIDVAVVAPQQLRVMRHHIAVVKLHVVLHH